MRKLAVHELDRLSAREYKALEKRPVCVVLDNIRSAHNVGSVFRTCDAFAVERVLLAGYTARPPHKDILKTALGADATVEWSHEQDIVPALTQLKQEGYLVCAVEQAEGSVALQDMVWEAGRKYALVFGNEVSGIGEATMQLADLAIEVPQWGTKHSLNISVCVGIVLWDMVRAST